MTSKPAPALSPIEARVLAVLVEKERTVPDTYPLTLNALAAGCNQKTSRDPVMSCSDDVILEALDSLRRQSLVLETSGGRVMRYSHNTKRVLEIPTESVALLAVLMLRGPQTAGELRLNCERLCRFSDISAVEGFLAELAERSAGALVVALPRQPGTREGRWATTIIRGAMALNNTSTATEAGDDTFKSAPVLSALPDDLTNPDSLNELRARVDRLEQRVAALSAALETLQPTRDS